MDDKKKGPERKENQGKEAEEIKNSRPFMKWVKLGIVIAGLLGEAYGANAIMNAYYPKIYKYLNSPSDETENIFEISNLIVNPEVPSNENPHFLVVSLGINLKDKEDINVLKNREAMAKDAIISVLSKYKVDYLRNPLNKEGLKQDIGIVVNRVLEKKAVKNLYFTKFVIQ